MAVAHLALDLRARHQSGDRIDDEDVDRVGADQGVGDLQRLLARVGLRDDQIVDVDAELAGVDRIERMLGVDEGGDTARGFCAAATAWSASVVLPELSGP